MTAQLMAARACHDVPWTDDAQSDGLVVLELEFKDGFDDGLAHGQAVLGLALLDDTELRRECIPLNPAPKRHHRW